MSSEQSSGGRVPADEIERRVREHLADVLVIARRLERRLGARLDVDELASAGREGLLQAARNYDPDRGVPFARFAHYRVKGAMIDVLRSHGSLPRRAYAELRALDAANHYGEGVSDDAAGAARKPDDADLTLERHLAGMATAVAIGLLAEGSGPNAEDLRDQRPSQEDELGMKELSKLVREALHTRPETERRLLEQHYFEGVTLEEAGRTLGLSKSWASRLHARAIDELARDLRKKRAR